MRALAFAAVTFAGAIAWADPADVAYEDGRRLYDLRDWDLAIAKFKEAYRLRPDAKSLFNIAQALRLKGDCVEATNFYRTYKRNFPTEPNVGKADKFIEELEPCANKIAKPEPKPVEPKPEPKPVFKPEPNREPVKPTVSLQPPPIEPSPPSPVEPRAEHPSNGSSQRTIGLAVTGFGSVMVASGVYFAFHASSLSANVADGTGVWNPDLQRQGHSADIRAKILSAGGAAAVATGLIVYLTAPKAKPRIAVVPHGNGAILVWSGDL